MRTGTRQRVVGPSVAAVDIDDRSHLDGTIVQRDPCGEHILGRARHPVGAVGVPADDGPARAGRGRLRDELIVPEPDLAGPGETAGDRPDDRVLDERPDLAILERGVFRVANRVAVARLPVPEATADRKTPVALARPVTLGAADRRIDHVVRSTFGVT